LLPLRRKPFAILRYLAENPRRLVTHDELLKHVWGATAVSESAVRTHLHELRQALGEGVIETVIGRGYRFTVEPSVEASAPAPRTLDAAPRMGESSSVAAPSSPPCARRSSARPPGSGSCAS
jgi:DNA-binding winged helix-turn-helix (wHTH) protein